MAQPDLSGILAALAQQRQGGTPSQTPHIPLPAGFPPPPHYANPPGSAPPFGLPHPISSGSVDLASIKPISSGSMSINDNRSDPRNLNRNYRRSRSPSRSPIRGSRDGFRDNSNPYRDERRGVAGGDRGYRDRSRSPGIYSPSYQDGRSPQQNRGGSTAGGDGESDVIPIEKSLVGLVIGRSGENLRRVETQTGARVQFIDGPETTNPQRHCRISGGRAARSAAKFEIFKIIEDNELAKRGQDKPRTQLKSTIVATKEGDSLQIMVPDRTVGLVIGRGGETIRDLQERSGCHVNIVGENKSVNGHRPVNLIGSAASQQRAKDLILEIVESDQKGISIKELRAQRNEDPYSKINDNIMVPGEAVGMIIGKGGETIRDMQNASGCKINVSPASGRDIEREIGLIGNRQSIDAAKRLILEKVHAVEDRNRAQSGEPRRDEYRGSSYGQGQPSYEAAIPPQAAPAPGTGGADPYAAYGGYQNYVQMWYAAMAAQQGQQPASGAQGQGEQR